MAAEEEEERRVNAQLRLRVQEFKDAFIYAGTTMPLIRLQRELLSLVAEVDRLEEQRRRPLAPAPQEEQPRLSTHRGSSSRLPLLEETIALRAEARAVATHPAVESELGAWYRLCASLTSSPPSDAPAPHAGEAVDAQAAQGVMATKITALDREQNKHLSWSKDAPASGRANQQLWSSNAALEHAQWLHLLRLRRKRRSLFSEKVIQGAVQAALAQAAEAADSAEEQDPEARVDDDDRTACGDAGVKGKRRRRRRKKQHSSTTSLQGLEEQQATGGQAPAAVYCSSSSSYSTLDQPGVRGQQCSTPGEGDGRWHHSIASSSFPSWDDGGWAREWAHTESDHDRVACGGEATGDAALLVELEYGLPSDLPESVGGKGWGGQ
mmetsp:Transcript_1360/g.4721  ORF Transcript_1360/g.4721 Transcript_1360/m.4721 type:complete len:380 (+) Transcript_1360:224-1363(+)